MPAPHSAASLPVHHLCESYTKGCPLYEFSPVFPFTDPLLSPQTTRFTALAALNPFLPLRVHPTAPTPGPRLEHGSGRLPRALPRCLIPSVPLPTPKGSQHRRHGGEAMPGVPRASRCAESLPGAARPPQCGSPPPPLRFPAGAIFWPAQLRAALPAAKWPPCCGDPGDGRAEGARRPPSPPSACAKCSVCEL